MKLPDHDATDRSTHPDPTVPPPGHHGVSPADRAGQHDTEHRIMLPRYTAGPLRQVARRLLMALLVMVATILIVYSDSAGYHDNSDGEVDFLDAVYYSTVTLSTTGYGDIVPYSDSARLSNVLLVTPLRVLFLIILVGTTLEVLTERTREQWRLTRWSQRFAGWNTNPLTRLAAGPA